jgi:hypothetical protein
METETIVRWTTRSYANDLLDFLAPDVRVTATCVAAYNVRFFPFVIDDRRL